MFNRNTLEGILSSFTKINTRLETFATSEETKAQTLADKERLAREEGADAMANAATARKISSKITALVS